MVSVRRLVDIPLPEYSDGDQSVWPDILPPEDVLSQPSASQLPTSQPATPSGREQKPYYHVSETRLNSFLSKVSAPLREYYTQYPNRCPALKGLNDARIEISAAARIPEMPAGYVLVEQRRTNKDGTRSKHIDVYIFGHPSGSKFRSTHEFIPHLLWLAMTETRDHAECTCKLCPNYVRRQGTPASVQRSSAKSFIDLVTPPMELKPTPVKRKAMARKSGAGTPGTPSNQPLKQTIAVDNDDPITVISPKLPSEKTYSHSGDVVGSSLAEIMAKNSSTTPSNSQKTDAHSGGLPSNRVALSVPHLNALPGSSPRNTPLRAKLPSGKRRQVETLIFDSPTPSSLIRPTKRRIDVVPDSIAGPSKEKRMNAVHAISSAPVIVDVDSSSPTIPSTDNSAASATPVIEIAEPSSGAAAMDHLRSHTYRNGDIVWIRTWLLLNPTRQTLTVPPVGAEPEFELDLNEMQQGLTYWPAVVEEQISDTSLMTEIWAPPLFMRYQGENMKLLPTHVFADVSTIPGLNSIFGYKMKLAGSDKEFFTLEEYVIPYAHHRAPESVRLGQGKLDRVKAVANDKVLESYLQVIQTVEIFAAQTLRLVSRSPTTGQSATVPASWDECQIGAERIKVGDLMRVRQGSTGMGSKAALDLKVDLMRLTRIQWSKDRPVEFVGVPAFPIFSGDRTDPSYFRRKRMIAETKLCIESEFVIKTDGPEKRFELQDILGKFHPSWPYGDSRSGPLKAKVQFVTRGA